MKRTRRILHSFGVAGAIFVAGTLLSTWRSLDQEAPQTPSQSNRAGSLKDFPTIRQGSSIATGTGPSIHDQSTLPSAPEPKVEKGLQTTTSVLIKERSSALGTTSPISNAAADQPLYELQTPITQGSSIASVDSEERGIRGVVVSPTTWQGNQSATNALTAEGGSSGGPPQGVFANLSRSASTVTPPVSSYLNGGGYTASSAVVSEHNEAYGSSHFYSSNYHYQEQLLKYGVMYGSAALNQAEESAPPQ